MVPKGVAIEECAAQALLEIPAEMAEPATDFSEPATDFVDTVTDPRGRLHVDEFVSLYQDYVVNDRYPEFVVYALSTVGFDIDYYGYDRDDSPPQGPAGRPNYPSYREVWDSTFFYVPGVTSTTAKGPFRWRFYSISAIHRATDGELAVSFPYLARPSIYVINNVCFGPARPRGFVDVEWARHVTSFTPYSNTGALQVIVLESIGFNSSCEAIFGSPPPLR